MTAQKSNHPAGLLDRLAIWAARQPQHPALIFLADGDQERERLDYGTLLHRIKALSAWLSQSIAPGERALLAPHSEVNYLVGLLACLHAGVVAVPTLTKVNGRALDRIQAHGEDAGACALLVDQWALDRHSRHNGDSGAWIHTIPWLNLEDAQGQAWQPTEQMAQTISGKSAECLAYLQYTSGSTSRPKGVMVTHANLSRQLGDLERVLDHRTDSVICNWMPLHHDFGLVMSLQALYSGSTVIMLPAVPTVQRPRRWLQAIGDYRVVTSAAPNFMFDRCVERIPSLERHDLDLSSLRHLLNAAEPIQSETLRAFNKHFIPNGFRQSAWVPAYGLAEATLMVSTGDSGKGVLIESFDPGALLDQRAVAALNGKDLVGCGTPMVEGSVSIVEPESGLPCPAGTIGEVWVACPSVAAGYWARKPESIDTFGARISSNADPRPHLRTGDLGFLWKGDLFIAGRLKDLIIVRGENHYPQDIEFTAAQSHSGLEPNAGAAFAIEASHGELLAVVQEVRREGHQKIIPEELFATIRHAVAENHGIDPAHIILLRPGGLPRTSSGKVQRRACRQAWLDGQLPILAEWSASSPALAVQEGSTDMLETEILAICRSMLRTERIDPQASLFEYGVDSLKAIEILLALEEIWKVPLDLADFADCSSVALLARKIRDGSGKPRATRQDQQFFRGDREERLPSETNALITKLRQYVTTWEGDRIAPGSLVVGRNISGKNSPLFWVFQGQQEFIGLADRLGPEQPVYGMRSGHQVMEYSEANIQALATSYRREITAICPRGPYLLGGNCQGGLIALAIAQQFWRLQQPVALLCLLEWAFQPQPYLGRVALFWGESSRQKNPFFRFQNPELYWRRAFGSYTMDIITGGHGEFFSGTNLDVLADRLAVRLREAMAAPTLLLPTDAYRAAYRLVNPPSQMVTGQKYMLRVEIRNLGSIDWASTEHSGLRLGNHWLDGDRQIVSWLDCAVPLPAIPAGGSITVELPMDSPANPGVYLLQPDLVEEGVTWFSERGVETPTVPITVVSAESG